MALCGIGTVPEHLGLVVDGQCPERVGRQAGAIGRAVRSGAPRTTRSARPFGRRGGRLVAILPKGNTGRHRSSSNAS